MGMAPSWQMRVVGIVNLAFSVVFYIYLASVDSLFQFLRTKISKPLYPLDRILCCNLCAEATNSCQVLFYGTMSLFTICLFGFNVTMCAMEIFGEETSSSTMVALVCALITIELTLLAYQLLFFSLGLFILLLTYPIARFILHK